MPEVNGNRLREVQRRAIQGARLWLDLHVAAANGDVEGCRGIWKHIRATSVEVSDLLKALGTESAP